LKGGQETTWAIMEAVFPKVQKSLVIPDGVDGDGLNGPEPTERDVYQTAGTFLGG